MRISGILGFRRFAAIRFRNRKIFIELWLENLIAHAYKISIKSKVTTKKRENICQRKKFNTQNLTKHTDQKRL